MAYDESTITDGPNIVPSGPSVIVSWASSAPAGTVFQVYVDRRHAWTGTARRCVLAARPVVATYRVGAVGSGEEHVDFGDSLPAAAVGPNRVVVTWRGGSYLGANLVGFHVYAGRAAGGAVDYTNLVGSVPAYTQAAVTDGAGYGGAGDGAAGTASANYSWTSNPLGSGAYQFAVVPVSRGGTEGTGTTVSSTIATAPRPPAVDPATGTRLTCAVDPGTLVPTLTWVASPVGDGPLPNL